MNANHTPLANSQLTDEQFFAQTLEMLVTGQLHDDLSPRSHGYPWEPDPPTAQELAREKEHAWQKDYYARVQARKQAPMGIDL